MAHNIEFKAELRDPEAARRQCSLLGAECLGTVRQTDVYFNMPEGRLKRREAPGEPIEWIFYQRRDIVRPRMSEYFILNEAQAKRRWGTANLREWVRVTKTRELWMLDNVRIHLDQVDGLGWFIELEAVVSKKIDTKACHKAIARLREAFGPAMGEPVAPSYSDLVAQGD